MSAIGTYRHLFTLEQHTTTSNGAGGQVEAWVWIANVRGKFDLKAHAEAVTGGRVQSTRAGVIEIRYRGTVTTTMRLVLNGRKFYVTSVPEPEETKVTGRIALPVEERPN